MRVRTQGLVVLEQLDSNARQSNPLHAIPAVPNFDGLRWGSVSRTLKGDAATWHYYTGEWGEALAIPLRLMAAGAGILQNESDKPLSPSADEHAPLGGNEGTPYVARTFLSLITCSSYLPPFSKGRQSTGTPARCGSASCSADCVGPWRWVAVQSNAATCKEADTASGGAVPAAPAAAPKPTPGSLPPPPL